MKLPQLSLNQSSLDRSIRIFLGVSLAIYTAPGTDFIAGSYLKYALFIFALANLFAAVTGWCVGYALFGFSTYRTATPPKPVTLDEAHRFSPDELTQSLVAFQKVVTIGVMALGAAFSLAFFNNEYQRAAELGLLQDRVAIYDLSVRIDKDVRAYNHKSHPEAPDLDSLHKHLEDSFSRSAHPLLVSLSTNGKVLTHVKNLSNYSERALLSDLTAAIGKSSTDNRSDMQNFSGVVAFEREQREFLGMKFTVDAIADLYVNVVMPMSERDKTVVAAMQRAALIIAISIWIVGWLTFVLMREVKRRIESANDTTRSVFRQIADHQAELEDEVSKRTAEAVEAKEEAIAASDAKSAFLANMSHEIRTPLNTIIGRTQLALKEDARPKLKKHLKSVNASAQLLLSIINDILDFSKIEAGKLVLETTQFNLELVASSVIDALSVKAQEKDIELVCEIDPALPRMVAGDHIRLTQILMNLGNNAVKFTDVGGQVVLRLMAQNRTQTQVVLHGEVEDTGIGISQDAQARLFQSFSQADNSTTRRFGGTGLGLAICKQITALMGGDIWVESEAGRGSTFHFTVQLSSCEDALSPDPETFKYRRILVVDDNDSARASLTKQLIHFPAISAIGVTSGAAAIKAVREAEKSNPFDLVFLDCLMPELNGFDTAHLMRHDNRIHRQPKIILMCGQSRLDAEIAESELDIDDVDTVTKPILPSELRRVLAEDSIEPGDAEAQATGTVDFYDQLEGIRILLAEDNPQNQELMEEILEDLGVQLTIVSNGWEAIEALDADDFDVVLMDGQMPVMDGYTATKAIRNQQRYKNLPIIALTANAMEQDKQVSLDAGMSDHISKPVDIDTMIQTIAQWVTSK